MNNEVDCNTIDNIRYIIENYKNIILALSSFGHTVSRKPDPINRFPVIDNSTDISIYFYLYLDTHILSFSMFRVKPIYLQISKFPAVLEIH